MAFDTDEDLPLGMTDRRRFFAWQTNFVYHKDLLELKAMPISLDTAGALPSGE